MIRSFSLLLKCKAAIELQYAKFKAIYKQNF